MARGDPFASEFAVQGYLESLAQRFVSVFDANCYLYISRAMDRFDLAAHGEPVALYRRAALEQALVIGVRTDLLFSVTEQQAIARALEAAGVATRFAPLDCIEGHDAFLIDLRTFGARDRRVPRDSFLRAPRGPPVVLLNDCLISLGALGLHAPRHGWRAQTQGGRISTQETGELSSLTAAAPGRPGIMGGGGSIKTR